jgi:transposase
MANKRNLIRNITSGRIDTAVGLARDLKDSIGVEVGPDTVRRALKEAGMKAVTKKKNRISNHGIFVNVWSSLYDISLGL